MTYTVVATDRATRSIALGTVSHSSSVLAKVLTGAGAQGHRVLVASQAFSSPALGAAVAAHALDDGDLREVPAICRASEGGGFRQVAMVTDRGGLATYTGDRCLTYAGDVVDVEAGVALAGNMLLDSGVLEAAHAAYLASTGALDERVLAALTAAGAAGGDCRGDRAAGLVTVGRYGDLHLSVDDHDRPHEELERLRVQARARAVLGSCFRWVERGCPADEVAPLTARLATAAEHDADVAVWWVVVSELAGLPRPPASAETTRSAAELVARMAAPRTDSSTKGPDDVD
ncbi:DUF1028 domain-containing protein [Nocardioides sp. LMS-CY]|uniref:DUF1028 domain-containing protein n=1 Tax=Nocardioides sp. (strain LMS-CY) TaxID=2840457 RepID=UPI001C00852E|nr:DUF1028 domain-containing protein [Nocardioides sp. LMS-CY]QWF20036.1 DUF1028 domain-containing protein [Nocardioides sp. LMS-CY]